MQEIENRRPEEPIYEEPDKIAPYFVVDLPSHMGAFAEGTPVHFEGQVMVVRIMQVLINKLKNEL